jgi:hypothetical protein
MDLRSLLTKLDNIDQAKLLQEAENVLEALTGIQYSDVEALARTLPPPRDTERAAALAKMAIANNLPGLFDPFTNKYVNANTGKFAMIGAYEAEVNLLKGKGLIPLGAETSNLGMGQDRAVAQAGNMSAQDVLKKAYRADAIMDKALPAMANQVQLAQPAAVAKESMIFTSGIANTLLEEFGYNKKTLLEAITKEEHAELKKLVVDLKPYEGSVHQVAQVMQAFIGYNRSRDQLIRQIMSLIARIKKNMAKKPVVTPKAAAATAVDQAGTPKAVQESIRINLAEGVEDQWLFHSGSLSEGTLKFVNSRTNKVYARGTIMEDVDGTQYVLVEAPAVGASASNVPKPAPAAGEAPAVGGNVPPQPRLNGKPSTGPKGQEWLEKYGKTHNPDGTPKAADTSKKKAEPERGTLQRVDDTIRAVANSWTGGWADNFEAKMNSWVNGTSYGEELKKSIAHTDAANKSALIKFKAFGKDWAPSAYDVGTLIGAATMFPKLGITGTAALVAADMAQEKLGRTSHNDAYTKGTNFKDEFNKNLNDVKNIVGLGDKDSKGQGGKKANIPFNKDVQLLQQQLIANGFDVGVHKDDGKLGDDTKAAIEKAAAAGWTYNAETKKLVKASAATFEPQPAAPERGAYLPPGSATDTSGSAQTADAAKEYSAADASRKAVDANTPAGSGNSNGLSGTQRYLQAIQVNQGSVTNDIQKALGITPTGELGPADVTAFTQYVQNNGGDPFDALGKLLGLTPEATTATESKNTRPLSLTESMAAMRSKLTQIDEAGGGVIPLITKLFGKGAEKEVAAGTKTVARDATSTTARDATTAAKPRLDDLPVTKHQATPGNLNFDAAKGERMTALDGKTYERMNGGSWYEVTASGKLGKGATREVQAELNAAAQTKGFDMQVMINKMATGEKLATEEIAAVEKSLAEKFGFKAGQAWAKVVAGGGKALRWMKNNRWMTAFILLSLAGLAWWALGNKEDPEDPTIPVNGKCKPGYTLSTDGKRCVPQGGKEPDVVTPVAPVVDPQTNEDLDELNGLLKELVDGWPDDAETAQAITAGAEVGAKPVGQPANGQGGKEVAGSSVGERTGINFANIKT